MRRAPFSRLSLACLALAAVLPGPRPLAAQAVPRSEPLPADSAVLIGELENGLRYYVRVNHEPRNRAELRLVVNAGSVLEDRDQRGLAHFLEHMAFNGTRHFAKQELVDYLESIGMRFGPDVNAYTSFDETVYMLTLPTDSAEVVETGFQILHDWATGIVLDSLEVEKERGVVIEEWRLGQGAGTRLQNKQFPVLAQRSRYAERLPIGSRESLETFSHAALRRFYRDWYRPDLMAVVAVGDFDAAQIEALIRAKFGSIPRPARPRRRAEFSVPGHRNTLFSVATDPEVTGTSVSLYLKREPRPWTSTAAYREWIIESLASSMLTNRLSELTQQPDAPFIDVSSFHGRLIRPLTAYVLNVRVPDEGALRGLEALLRETARASRFGFTATELEREKRELMRVMEQRFAEREKTTSGGFAADYVSHFLYGGVVMDVDAEYRLHRRFLPGITLLEVNQRAQVWTRTRDRVVLVRAPQRPGVRVPNEARLRQAVAAVRRAPLEPYDDRVSSAPLLPHLPEPGTVVSEVHLPDLGVREWTLSNGVRVLLKPTDFREDEVLLVARSPGGTSLVPDSDYIAALTAAAVVQVGGVGELSSVELRKRLAGTVAGVGADIGELHEGLSGAASPRDLETLFQLVYLKFTAPRMDSTAFLAYRSQARASLENRSASPELLFQDTLRVLLAQNHPRAQPPSAEIFDHLDLHRSFAIYRDRFADASDFTFYLVGSFQPERLRPLVERYLGSLPALGRKEQPRDLGIRPPTGVVRRTVRKGLEPKALTQIVFTGPFEFSQENLYALTALGELLQIRLREVLREDLGGTYGASVHARGGREPWPQFQLSVRFGVDPERLEELTGVVFAQIDSLQRFGPAEKDLLKVREMMLRSRELDLRRNQFWAQQLIAHDRYGWDLRELLAFASRVAALDTATIRDAARRYLPTDNYVQVSLLPERLPRTDAATQGARGEPSGRDGVSPASVPDLR